MEIFNGVLGSRITFNENLKAVIHGEFQYKKTTEIPCYDKNGNFLLNHENIEYYSKSNQSDFIENLFDRKIVDNVFQKDFNFYILKTFYYSNHEDLQKYDWSTLNCKIDYKNEREIRYKWNKTECQKYAETNEMCIIGTENYSVFHNLSKKIINFNYKTYNQNRLIFIKQNPKLENEVNYIFNLNLLNFSNYFMCDVEHLKSSKFNMKEQFIKRLMFKINNKTK